MTMTNLDHGIHGPGGGVDADPVRRRHMATPTGLRLTTSHHDPPELWLNLQDIQGDPGGETQAVALSNRETVNPAVPAQEFALGVHDFPILPRHLTQLFLDEAPVAFLRHETDVHTFRLFRDRQARFPRQLPHRLLVKITQGETSPVELRACKSEEKVGLVLFPVFRSK